MSFQNFTGYPESISQTDILPEVCLKGSNNEKS